MWRDRSTGKQMANIPRGLVRGTLFYRSLNSHFGWPPSRADDLESLAYTLIYLQRRQFPWEKFNEKENTASLIYTAKAEISPDELCTSCPSSVKKFLVIVREIDFREDQDYDQLMSPFEETKYGSLPKSITSKRKHLREEEDNDNLPSLKKTKDLSQST